MKQKNKKIFLLCICFTVICLLVFIFCTREQKIINFEQLNLEVEKEIVEYIQTQFNKHHIDSH